MSNTLTGLIPTLYEALDVVSREMVGFIPAVNTDHQAARAAVGQPVLSFASPAVVTANITPGVTAPNDGDQVITNIPLFITKSKYAAIRYGGEEALGLNNNGPQALRILSDQFQQGFRALVNEMETDIWRTAYQGASRAVGTAGTTPFGTNGVLSDFALARQVLEDNGAPTSTLQYVAGSNAMANLRGKQAVLFRVNEAGSSDMLRTGLTAEVEGFQLRNSNSVQSVTKGTGAAYTTSAAGFAKGATSIGLITGAGTVLAGDVVSFAGDTNNYVVTTGIAAPGTVVIAAPGLRQALPAAATAVTVGASFVANMAFSRNAIALATRLPANIGAQLGGKPGDMADDVMIMTDAMTGLNFEVSLYRQYRQIRYEIGIAWGQSAIKPEHLCIGLG